MLPNVLFSRAASWAHPCIVVVAVIVVVVVAVIVVVVVVVLAQDIT